MRATRSTFIFGLTRPEDQELTAFRELANCFASPQRKLRIAPNAYGRGAGVGRGRGVGAGLGVGVCLGVAVAVGVGEGDAQGLTGQLKISVVASFVTPSSE